MPNYNWDEIDNTEQENKPNQQGRMSSPKTFYDTDTVVSVGQWILLNLVIGIIGIIPTVGPIIDLIILIFMSLADINKSLKNWARATLILGIIAFVIVLIFFAGSIALI